MNHDIIKAIAEQIPTPRMVTDRWAYTHRIAKRIYARLELLGVKMEITTDEQHNSQVHTVESSPETGTVEETQ